MVNNNKKLYEGKTEEEMQDEDYVQMVGDVYELNSKKYVFERQWYMNIAFLSGQQWVKWDNRLKRLYEPKVPNWRVRHVANDIMPTFRKKVAKLKKKRPTLYISAGKTDIESEKKMKESNELIEAWWSSPVIDVEGELDEWLKYGCSCGTGFMKVFYDPTLGKKRASEDGQTWSDGEIQLEACSPFEIILDPFDARKWKDLRKILHSRARTLDYIVERYPENGGEVQAEKDESVSNSFWRKIQGMVGAGTDDGGISQVETSDNSAIVKELWVKPCKQFPKGKKIVVANKKLLEKNNLPYSWNDSEEPFLPFVPLYDFKMAGRILGRSNIEDEIPIQKAKNELISHIRESERLTSKPKFLKPKGCGVDNITSEPGENVEWDPTTTAGHKPGWLVPPTIPNYVISGLDNIYQRDYQNITSQHEISKGNVPAGVTSGVAINYLQESDDTIVGDITANYERALEKVGNMMLSIAAQNYTEERVFFITGKYSGKPRTLTFKPNVVGENGEVTEEGTIPKGGRIIVEAGSAMARTKSGQQAFYLDLYKIGALGAKDDPKTNKKLMRLLEVGNVDELYEEEGADRMEAQIENDGFKRNITAIVRPYQGHEVHVDTHDAFMKTEEFGQLSEDMKNEMIKHRQEHLDFIKPEEPAPGQAPQAPEGEPEQ